MTRHAWIVCLGVMLTYAVLLTGKPVHIDDPVVLHVSQQVLQNPADPFGGEIDWFGYLQPTWSSTTNPPLLSYYLAPFLWMSHGSDAVLHLAMLPFIGMLLAGMWLLTRRFAGETLWPLLVVLASPAVLVSVNLMRDVPALAFMTLAVALFIRGVDDDRPGMMALGSTLAGCAILTKYAAGILLPLLVLYPLVHNRWKSVLWVWPAAAILGLWCVHNALWYGQVHIIYLLLERRDDSGIPFQDKFYGSFLVLGSALYLLPAALLPHLRWQRWWVWGVLAFLLAGLGRGISLYLRGMVDVEYFLWALTGGAVFVLAAGSGLGQLAGERRWPLSRNQADALFLLGWLAMPMIFAWVMVPFQAVRHLLPGVPPLVLLIWISFQSLSGWRARVLPWMMGGLLALQALVAAGVQWADHDYAASYRTFARQAALEWTSTEYETWYVGHWGWSYYATQNGLRQMRLGEWPREGDLVIVPFRVDKGHVLRDDPFFFDRQEQLAEIQFEGTIPIRSQNFWGAGFYSVITIWGRNIPYRIGQDLYLEKFMVYRVVEPDLQDTDASG